MPNGELCRAPGESEANPDAVAGREELALGIVWQSETIWECKQSIVGLKSPGGFAFGRLEFGECSLLQFKVRMKISLRRLD